MASNGRITRQQFLKSAPLQRLEQRHSIFNHIDVHAPTNKKDSDERMLRRPTAAAKPQNKDKNAALAAKAAKARAEESKITEGDEDEDEGEVDEAELIVDKDTGKKRRKSDLEMAIEVSKTMEEYAEKRDFDMGKFVSKLVKHYPDMKRVKEGDSINSSDTKFDKLMEKGWPGTINVERSYDGPHLTINDKKSQAHDKGSGPISMDSMYDLASHYFDLLNPEEKKTRGTVFKKKKRRPTMLHPKYVLTILAEYLKVLRDVPNVVRVSTAVSQSVTIVGDLHGQLRDLQLIFEQNSMPSSTNPYVFNGDLVDRGTHSLEVCIILFGLAVADPTCVRINRGNHEDYSVCDTYGFTDEIFTKYPGKMGIEIAELFAEVFAFLPIATVIDDSVLVIHGGLGRYDLEYLNGIARHHFKTLQGVPEELWEGEDYGSIKHDEWQALMDALWSDPQACSGMEPNYKRGAGATHECVEFGYEMHHNNRVMTLFSASCYYDGESNWGAYARLNSTTKDKDTDEVVNKSSVTLHQYCCEEDISKMAKWQKHDAAEVTKASVERIRLILYEYKERLREEFSKLDVKKSGSITKTEWARTMSHVVAIRLPWLHLLQHFIPANQASGKTVEYLPFIEELNASFTSVKSSMEVPIPEYIYRNLPELEAVFRLMNVDGTGVVSRAEFENACDSLSMASKSQISAEEKEFLVQQLDPNNTDQISFVDFLNSIRYQYMDTGTAGEGADLSDQPALTAEEVDAMEGESDEEQHDDVEDEPDLEDVKNVKKVRPRELSISVKMKAPSESQASGAGRRVRSASAVGKLRVSRDGAHSANSSTVLASIAARVGK
ncbi:manganese ion binding protein [Aureococcus anophagefferens]|nr:manganese ion binding protein [Aureococcus anophagefferens]